MVAQPQPPLDEPDLLPESKYTIALERQLEALHMMRTRKPYDTVARHVARERGEARYAKPDYSMDTAVAEALARATPYYWAEAMNRLVVSEAEAGTLAAMRLTPDLLPDAHGYLWFENPILIQEGDPEEVRALVWEPALRHGAQGYMVTVFTGYPTGLNLGLPSMNVVTGSPRTPVHWRVGDTVAQWLAQIDLQYEDPRFRETVRYIAGMPAAKHAQQLKMFAIFFAAIVEVLNQRLTRVAGARGDRASRRRAQHLLGKPDIPMTRVILLRPIDYVTTGEPSEPGDPVAWSHRWEVREHTRMQRYGPGNSLVRKIVIRSHVKGPANLPLITPTPIKAIVR